MPSPPGPGPKPGNAGEELACRHLSAKGLRILARNYRCRSGEIDVVAEDGATLVFVEVKERWGDAHGSAVEAVTAVKRRRVLRAARFYAALHEALERSVRFDVVSIDWGPEGPRVRHDKGAFSET